MIHVKAPVRPSCSPLPPSLLSSVPLVSPHPTLTAPATVEPLLCRWLLLSRLQEQQGHHDEALASHAKAVEIQELLLARLAAQGAATGMGAADRSSMAGGRESMAGGSSGGGVGGRGGGMGANAQRQRAATLCFDLAEQHRKTRAFDKVRLVGVWWQCAELQFRGSLVTQAECRAYEPQVVVNGRICFHSNCTTNALTQHTPPQTLPPTTPTTTTSSFCRPPRCMRQP
jgi:hypothetical protein